ncbi:MAG: cytochrome-c peroxidase [Marinilabiliales bacterium]|nr:MAG: cytochrome-c peroxidase [Marinilabiliales bacterium]
MRSHLVPALVLSGSLTAFIIFMFSNCNGQRPSEMSQEQVIHEQALVFFRPMPENAFKEGEEACDELIELGKMLYYEPRLSKSGLISCHTCHNFGLAGVDNLPVSIGHMWQKGPRNAPTVLNAALHSSQFLDGREPDVESQALMPILDPVEMASSEEHVLAVIGSIPEYVERFRRAFPEQQEPLVYENVGIAIGAFERILLTFSPFDSFLKGDMSALSEDELRGLVTFIDVGCTTCHVRETLGGHTFAKSITPRELSGDAEPDLGRFEFTGREEDKHFFKVPSLLNVAETFPYFHDGSEWSLREATRVVAMSQLDVKLTDDQLNDLVSFMESLSGEVPEYARLIPVLPPSTETTPLPVFD